MRLLLLLLLLRKTRGEKERNFWQKAVWRRIFSSKKNIIKYKKSAENFSAHEFSPDDDGVLDSYPTKGTGQKVRRNDRLATDFGRVGDFFCRCGVYRGGVSGDWDQREQRRYAICACISN